mmetsp:Transcript_50802/g.121439  ORF Transcript_50802/g.121439 Transcript_50802/m.121439 type:complete len:231 (+) Transcript_50802:702-1394(+)
MRGAVNQKVVLLFDHLVLALLAVLDSYRRRGIIQLPVDALVQNLDPIADIQAVLLRNGGPNLLVSFGQHGGGPLHHIGGASDDGGHYGTHPGAPNLLEELALGVEEFLQLLPEAHLHVAVQKLRGDPPKPVEGWDGGHIAVALGGMRKHQEAAQGVQVVGLQEFQEGHVDPLQRLSAQPVRHRELHFAEDLLVQRVVLLHCSQQRNHHLQLASDRPRWRVDGAVSHASHD